MTGIDLDAPAATAAARRLHRAGEAMRRERDHGAGARVEQAGQGQPWGRDELGATFAQKYADDAAALLALWRDAAHRTMDMGVDIARAVEVATGVDALSGERLTQVRV